jgi:hypothetical protein
MAGGFAELIAGSCSWIEYRQLWPFIVRQLSARAGCRSMGGRGSLSILQDGVTVAANPDECNEKAVSIFEVVGEGALLPAETQLVVPPVSR